MFTENQLSAIEHFDGHAIINAVAGSGKTTTIVALVKKLIDKGVVPTNITFVVFNKDARRDITKKLIDTGIESQFMPKVHTFHSLAYSIYQFLSKKGFIRFNRLETNEVFLNKFSQRCLNEAKSKSESKLSYASKEEVEAFINFIDIAKSSLLQTKEVFEIWFDNERYCHFCDAFDRFEEQRKSSNFITFSDLIKDIVVLCNSNINAQNLVKGHVEYLLMDEVQDINEVSIALSKIISGDKTNWIMVGDVDQCIYSWRGAEPEYLSHRLKSELSKSHPVKEYELPHTFRYGHRISLLANHVVSFNQNRTKTLCISANNNYDTDISIEMYDSKGRFGKKVLDTVKNEINHGRALSDIGILVRLFSFSSEIELELLKNNIPYELEGSQTVFNKREVSALIALMKISNNSLFSESADFCAKLLNDLFELCFFGVKIRIDPQQVEMLRASKNGISNFINSFKNNNLSRYKKEKLLDLSTSIKSIESRAGEKISPEVLISTFIKFNDLYSTIDLFAVRKEDYDNKVYTIKSFISFIQGLNFSVNDVLKKLDELSNTNNLKSDRITISSIHRAKGREWPVILIPGLEDGLFPYTRKDNNCDIESERRLFYVAITRCIEKLYYLCPKDISLIRAIQRDSALSPPDSLVSRFVFESRPFLSKILPDEDLTTESPNYKKSVISKAYIDALEGK